MNYLGRGHPVGLDHRLKILGPGVDREVFRFVCESYYLNWLA